MTETPLAGVRSEPSAITENASGTPIGTELIGAETSVRASAGAGIVTDAAGDDGGRIIGGQIVHLDVDRTGNAGGGGGRDGRDFVGRDAGDQSLLAADLHGVRGAKAHAVNHDGSARGRQTQRLHGVGVEHPALVGVIRATVAALIGNAQADNVVA